MQDLKRFFVTLFIIIGFSVAGVIAGYLAGITWSSLRSEARFSHWQELESSLKFRKITGVTFKTVWAKTIDGELYSWDASCFNGPNCNQWIPVKETPGTDYKYDNKSIKRFKGCPASNVKDIANPPGDVVECILVKSSDSNGTANRLVYYVLLEDGKVWAWEINYSSMNDLSYSFRWICPGSVIGIVAFVVFMLHREKNKVKTDTENKQQYILKLKNFLFLFLLLIGFSIGGTAIGYFVGATYADFKGEGKFSTWDELEGNLKFEQIVDATTQIIWARTAGGTMYSLDTNCAHGANCYEWIQTKEAPADIHEYGGQSIERGSTCPSSNLKYFTAPPGNLVECVRAITPGMDIAPGITVYYALSDSGKIWMWKYSYSMMDDLIYAVLCTCPGLILGIVAFIILMVFRKKRTSKIIAANNQGTILQ